LLQDQKGIWLFPVQAREGAVLAPTIAVTGVTARLSSLIPTNALFQAHLAIEGFNDAFSGTITAAEIGMFRSLSGGGTFPPRFPTRKDRAARRRRPTPTAPSLTSL